MTRHHRPEWAGDESPGEHGRHLAARALAAAISAWSEREHYATWMIGIEDAAWAETEAGSEVGMVFRQFASWAGGWVEWGDLIEPCLLDGGYDTDGEGVRFVAWVVS